MKRRNSGRLNRRQFGAIIAAGSAAPALMAQQASPASAPNPNTSEQRRGTIPETPPFQGPIEFTRRDVPLRAEPFPMTQVRLLPSFYQDAQEWNRGYVARLEADRLLYNFRANAGLPNGKTKPLGGWEQPANADRSSELRGHFTGHFLSASAQLFASTGDRDAKAKADETVD